MGMRLEPGGEYTGVTLDISDDVPDHDCEEMLAKIKVRLLKTLSRLSESKLKIPYWYFEYYENEIWTIYAVLVCVALIILNAIAVMQLGKDIDWRGFSQKQTERNKKGAFLTNKHCL